MYFVMLKSDDTVIATTEYINVAEAIAATFGPDKTEIRFAKMCNLGERDKVLTIK